MNKFVTRSRALAVAALIGASLSSNAFAMGRPVITRKSHYQGQLAEDLMTEETCIDIDRMPYSEVRDRITYLTANPSELEQMGLAASRRFDEVVDYNQEAKEIWQWLETLR